MREDIDGQTEAWTEALSVAAAVSRGRHPAGMIHDDRISHGMTRGEIERVAGAKSITLEGANRQILSCNRLRLPQMALNDGLPLSMANSVGAPPIPEATALMAITSRGRFFRY